MIRSSVCLIGLCLLACLPTAARAQDPPPPPPDEAGPPKPTTTTTGTNRYLLLPDISFIGILDGLWSNDRSQSGRGRLLFREGEIAIQSFVYPGIKQDAFIVFGDGETVVEEAYLTVQRLTLFGQPYSATFGRRKVPFGRTNQLHPHSWPYIVRPAVLTNLVAQESLNGDGAYVSYLLPTHRLFLQLDAGLFWQKEPIPDGTDAPSGEAGFRDSLGTARLWAAHRVGQSDVELCGSLARGKGLGYDIPQGEGPVAFRPTTTLTGLDATVRLGGNDAKRTLLRAEWVGHDQRGQGIHRHAEGYYVSADRRFNSFDSMGLRFDHTGNPFQSGREKTVSLIATHQLTEQTYLRAQATAGERFGERNVRELRLQWVWGVGPHTHNLE